jgi:hypothetical protein
VYWLAGEAIFCFLFVFVFCFFFKMAGEAINTMKAYEVSEAFNTINGYQLSW